MDLVQVLVHRPNHPGPPRRAVSHQRRPLLPPPAHRADDLLLLLLVVVGVHRAAHLRKDGAIT